MNVKFGSRPSGYSAVTSSCYSTTLAHGDACVGGTAWSSLSDWWDSILIVTVQSRVETNRIGYLRTDCQITVCQRRTLNREKRTSKE